MDELEEEKIGIYQTICSNPNCRMASAKLMGTIHHRRVVCRPTYCFACRLVSMKESAFATWGFNYWKHSNLTVDHENGIEHLKCMTAYNFGSA